MIIQCKMCGGDLNLTNGSSIAKCEYCGTLQTVPIASSDGNEKINLFDRANGLRISCEFDKAAPIYESIIAKFPEEAEAYWGALLCKYGIEYVDDPATGKKIPTCHRLSFDRVLNDSYYTKALDLADDEAKSIYETEAKSIETIRSKIITASNKEDPYDVFICYKESDDNGQRTEDSVIAEKIYNELTEKKYRVFFAKISLEDKLGEEYEPYIFAALNSARVMLSVGSSSNNFNSTWVRNEWSRFIDLMKSSSDKVLIPCYYHMDPYDLPKEFSGLQAQDLGKVGAVEDIARGITKIIPKGTQKVGITEDVLTSVLKKESHKRTIRSIIAFVLIAAVLGIGGYYGITKLSEYIDSSKETEVTERRERETEKDPTPSPSPTPVPDWQIGRIYVNTEEGNTTDNFSEFNYGVTTVYCNCVITDGPTDEQIEMYYTIEAPGFNPRTFYFEDAFYVDSTIWCYIYSTDGTPIATGTYAVSFYEVGTNRFLGSTSFSIR